MNQEQSVKILRASAGSGKTYRLAYEYIRRVVEQPLCYSSILAVTFTNKATEEMKSRIISSLNELANANLGMAGEVEYMESLHNQTGLAYVIIKQRAAQAKSLILHDYSNFAVSTIDKFFQRIARAFFKELGLDFSYEVELAGNRFLEKAVVNLIENAGSDSELAELIDRVQGEELEGNKWNIKDKLVRTGELLTKEDYKSSNKGALELIAIMQQASEMVTQGVDEIRFQAQTIINSIRNAGIQPADFKGGSRSFMVTIEQLANGREIKTPTDAFRDTASGDIDGWVTKKSSNLALLLSVASDSKPLVESLVEMINTFMELNNSYKAVNVSFSRYLLLGNLSRELDRLWGENNRLPIHRTTSLIADIAANTEIPFIYEKLGTHYDCYMIDEFQDTSSGQWQGFKPLLHEAISHTQRESVMLIGDVKQAIYRWRGGDWNILANQAANEFIGRVDASEQLNTNWRSLPHIVEFNNKLLESIIRADNNEIQAIASSKAHLQALYGNSLIGAYDSFTQNSRPKATGGYVELNITDEPILQTLNTIKELIDNQNYQQKDIAIIVRRKSEGNTVAISLIEAGYNVISDEALYISTSPTVQFIITLLKLASNPSDTLAAAQYNLYHANALSAPLTPETKKLLATLSLCSPITAIEKIIDSYNLFDKETTYLQALYQSIYTISTTQSADLRQFLIWWDEAGKNTSLSLPKDQDAITIITVHKSKGLQFPCVILPYANWELTPRTNSQIWAATDKEPLCELENCLVNYTKALAKSHFIDTFAKETIYAHIDNINLLYVALTRAEETLYITTPTKPEKSSIATLINQCAKDIATTLTDNQLIFGQLTKHLPKPNTQTYTSISFASFDSDNPTNRTATTLPHYRVNSEAATKSLSPDKRFYGILMHEIFSQIEVADDIENVIKRMTTSGRLDISEANKLQENIQQALQNPIIAEWFAPGWEVINERSIIRPKEMESRRPDRVLISPQRTMVIDYKFGLPKPDHRSKVMEYANLLQSMGYPSPHPYLWYVTTGEVVDLSSEIIH